MAFTFQVCDVDRATAPLPETSPREAVVDLLGTPVEACGAGAEKLVPVEQNAFLAAAWRAYADHRPLVLTPDAVWLCIAQGFAAHVDQDPEALRGRFVRHPGSLTLEVQRHGFHKGSPGNDWPGVFAELSDQIAAHVGRQRDLVVSDFSTTGPVERAASELVLLDAMQHYFEYVVLTICGIPEITLTGTIDDWKSIRRRTRMLAEYNLGWWTAVLLPVLDEFVAAAEGRPDVAFWQSFFKDTGGSGGPYLHGWIVLLFPYFDVERDGRQARAVNPVIARARGASPIRPGGGAADWIRHAKVHPSCIPLGLACAPMTWVYFNRRFAMDFIGGFMGIAQDPTTFAIWPAIGWAVRDHADAVRVRQGQAPRYPASRAPDPDITVADIDRLFGDNDSQYTGPGTWSGDRSPDDGVLFASERVTCSRVGNGRLLLDRTGLHFVPGSAPDAGAAEATPWLGRALTDDEDMLPDRTDSFVALRGRPPAEQVAAVPGAIHLAAQTVMGATFTTLDHGVETVVDGRTMKVYTGDGPAFSLEIAVLLPDGERLTFTLADPPREPLAAWRAAIGHAP